MAPEPEGPAKIRALHAGFRSLNWVFVGNMVLALWPNGGRAFWTGAADTTNPLLLPSVRVATTFSVVCFVSRTPCERGSPV